MWDPEHFLVVQCRAVCVSVYVWLCVMKELRGGYESFSMLIWAKILSAGPSLMFMVPIRWSSFSSSRACPSISWERNSSAISRQPAPTARRGDESPHDYHHCIQWHHFFNLNLLLSVAAVKIICSQVWNISLLTHRAPLLPSHNLVQSGPKTSTTSPRITTNALVFGCQHFHDQVKWSKVHSTFVLCVGVVNVDLSLLQRLMYQ